MFRDPERNGGERRLTSSGLIAVEPKVWSKFEGNEVAVLPPPQDLFESWRQAEENLHWPLGVCSIPKNRWEPKKDYPGWPKKEAIDFWSGVSRDAIVGDPLTTIDMWMLAERRISYYVDDPLRGLIERLRKEKSILSDARTAVVNFGSRRGIEKEELRSAVFPELANLLGVNSQNIRNLRAVEFGLLFKRGLLHIQTRQGFSFWLDDC